MYRMVLARGKWYKYYYCLVLSQVKYYKYVMLGTMGDPFEYK